MKLKKQKTSTCYKINLKNYIYIWIIAIQKDLKKQRQEKPDWLLLLVFSKYHNECCHVLRSTCIYKKKHIVLWFEFK